MGWLGGTFGHLGGIVGRLGVALRAKPAILAAHLSTLTRQTTSNANPMLIQPTLHPGKPRQLLCAMDWQRHVAERANSAASVPASVQRAQSRPQTRPRKRRRNLLGPIRPSQKIPRTGWCINSIGAKKPITVGCPRGEPIHHTTLETQIFDSRGMRQKASVCTSGYDETRRDPRPRQGPTARSDSRSREGRRRRSNAETDDGGSHTAH